MRRVLAAEASLQLDHVADCRIAAYLVPEVGSP